MKGSVDFFYMRAHLVWNFFAINSLVFVGFYFADKFWEDEPIIYCIHILISYFIGIFFGINIWSFFEFFVNKNRYRELMKYFEDVIFFGFFLKKIIFLK